MTTIEANEARTDEGASIRWDDFRALWDRTSAESRRRGRTRTDMAAAALWLSALFVVFITWNGAAGKTSVGEQVPYLLSGGLAMVSLAVAGSVVFLLGVLSAARGDDEHDAELRSETGVTS